MTWPRQQASSVFPAHPSILERKREFALWRIISADEGAVRRSIVIESAAVGLNVAGPADLQVTLGFGEVGFAESLADAVARDPDVEIAIPLVRGTIALADDPAEALQLFGTDQLRLPLDRMTVDPSAQLAIAALGVTTALGASYAAARRIRALDPLEVLRRAHTHQSLRQPDAARLTAIWTAMTIVSAFAFAIEVRLKSFAWGNVGSTIWNASVFVLAVPLVAWAARRWQTLLPRTLRSGGPFRRRQHPAGDDPRRRHGGAIAGVVPLVN